MNGTLEIIHGLIICLRNQLKANEQHHVIWASILNILEHSEALLDELRQHGPTLKSRFLEWTDAGPGVGITNHDVKYRIAQRIRIMNADYLIRLHLSNGDSSHNEVESARDLWVMQYAMEDQLSGSTKNFLMTSLLKNSKR